MDQLLYLQKLHEVYDLLFTLAKGGRLLSFKPGCAIAELDLMRAHLLEFGVQLHHLETAAGIDPTSDSFIRITHFELLLDAELNVVNCNNEASTALGYAWEALTALPFDALLTVASQEEWRLKLQQFLTAEPFAMSLDLVFISNTLQLLPLHCRITSLARDALILVSSCTTFFVSSMVRNEETAQIRLEQSALVIYELRDYILNHLDEPLPPIKKLALILGTEQTRLKVGFRALYNCSPYAFYQEERLKKAHALVQHTRLELKQIAFMCGFTTYMNFYKVFKKRYGHAPSALLRLFDLRDEL